MPRHGKAQTGYNDPLKQFMGTKQTAAGQGSNTPKADWSQVDATLVHSAVIATTYLGGAILIGVSKDGYVFNVSIFRDGDKQTYWFRPDDQGLADLEELLGNLTDLAEHMRTGT